jgi:hypothetical protein
MRKCQAPRGTSPDSQIAQPRPDPSPRYYQEQGPCKFQDATPRHFQERTPMYPDQGRASYQFQQQTGSPPQYSRQGLPHQYQEQGPSPLSFYQDQGSRQFDQGPRQFDQGPHHLDQGLLQFQDPSLGQFSSYQQGNQRGVCSQNMGRASAPGGNPFVLASQAPQPQFPAKQLQRSLPSSQKQEARDGEWVCKVIVT